MIEGQAPDIGEMVLHHTADAWTIDLYPIGAIHLPRWAEGRRNVYYWYYATQVMHHMEGEAWDKWNTALRDQITSAQVKVGKLSTGFCQY